MPDTACVTPAAELPAASRAGWLRRRLYARIEQAPALEASAIVFAPHQDDETLGCGGTLVLKRRAGARVSCVFMTDGSTSHRGLIGDGELRDLRRAEAIEAAAVMGIAREDVHFLDFPDSRLAACHAAAVTRVAGLLEQQAPDQVFVPYRGDGTPDHEATYRIVAAALDSWGRRTRMFEYPVWAWNGWPWVPLQLSADRAGLERAARAVRTGFSRELRRGFRSGLRIAPVLAIKRRALQCHRSQMSVLVPGVAWPTLGDVSGGAFLECFFQEYEIFRESAWGGGRA